MHNKGLKSHKVLQCSLKIKWKLLSGEHISARGDRSEVDCNSRFKFRN